MLTVTKACSFARKRQIVFLGSFAKYRELRFVTVYSVGQSLTMKTVNKEFLKKFNSYDKHIRPNPEEPLEVTITLLVQFRNQISFFFQKKVRSIAI